MPLPDQPALSGIFDASGQAYRSANRVSATYAIDKTQWEEIEQVVKKSDAFEEYMPGFTPKAEHNYGSVISEIMITAQPNDFSTVTIVQNASTGKVEVSRSYLFQEKMDEVLPDVPLELILNVTIKQEAGKSSVAITANVDLSYHLYYAEGIIILKTNSDSK